MIDVPEQSPPETAPRVGPQIVSDESLAELHNLPETLKDLRASLTGVYSVLEDHAAHDVAKARTVADIMKTHLEAMKTINGKLDLMAAQIAAQDARIAELVAGNTAKATTASQLAQRLASAKGKVIAAKPAKPKRSA